jgi:hypothetical protein
MKNPNNFDFLVGTWTSTQRRLREVLNGCEEWYEFPGVTRSWSVLDGAANIDEVTFPTQGFSGLTVRLQDKETGLWSIYWANSRDGRLALPPQVGRFDDNGRGEFFADDVYNGQKVKVVYVWFDITEDSARWEQAFSPDDGATWEANWTAEFTRTA